MAAASVFGAGALPQPPASGIYVETKVWGDGRRTSRKVAR